MRDDLARSITDNVLDACARYERRELTEPELRDALGRSAVALRAVQADAAKVLASFVTALELVERTCPPERRWAETSLVLERVRDFAARRAEPARVLAGR